MANFQRGSVTFDQALNFTRGSEATYFDSSGVLQTAAVNEPRFDHDPVTGEPLGLLIEEQRTNLLLWSDDLTSTAWTKGGLNITGNAVTAPDGALSADAVTPSSTNQRLWQPVTASVSGMHTLSAFVKPGTGRYVTLRSVGFGEDVTVGFDLVSATAGPGGVIEALKDGWFRCSIAFDTTGDLTGEPSVYFSDVLGGFSGAVGLTFYVWGAQFEGGAFASSRIPTEAAQVTRLGDTLDRATGAELNPSEFTVFCEFEVNGGDNTDNTIFSVNNGTQNEQLDLRYISSATNEYAFRLRVGGTNVISQLGGPKTGGVDKVALSLRAGELVYALNGVAQTEAGAVMPSGLSMLDIGQRVGGSPADSFRIKSLHLHPRAYTAEELQELTAP